MNELEKMFMENADVIMDQARHNTEVLKRLGILPPDLCERCNAEVDKVMHCSELQCPNRDAAK